MTAIERLESLNLGSNGLAPPQDEQQAIVKHVRIETKKLDALAEATEHTTALLQERRSALISAAVTGQLKIPTPLEAPCESTS